MADRGILFSAPMVRALLARRKTQTRRLIKGGLPEAPSMESIGSNQVARHPAPYLDAYCSEPKTAANPRGMSTLWCWWTRDDRMGRDFRVPYKPGDRLYVREAWAPLHALTHNDPGTRALCDRGFYRADDSTVDGEILRWRPSIHQPRWASRLTLRVTDVSVERLQAISEADAEAEGIERSREFPERFMTPAGDYAVPIVAFQRLWESIHGRQAWDANPYVVATTFSVVEANIDTLPMAVAA